MFKKSIICLAKSIKHSGRCIAGKDKENLVWVRPVSDSSQGELSEDQIKYADNEKPALLDIIKIPFKSNNAKYYQPENIIIDDGAWEYVGRFPQNKLAALCDNPTSLWDNNHPNNQMISLDYLKGHGITSSLLFIKADTINIFVNINYVGEKKYRAIFKYNGIEYDLPITDPIIRDEYESYQPGSYQLKDKDIYLCLSIGEPFQPPGSESYFCYKLVAAIIRVNK